MDNYTTELLGVPIDQSQLSLSTNKVINGIPQDAMLIDKEDKLKYQYDHKKDQKTSRGILLQMIKVRQSY